MPNWDFYYVCLRMIIEKIDTPGPEGPFPGIRRGAHLMVHRNWVDAPGVQVSFSVRHDGSSIYLIYFVEEPHLRATCTEFNSPVWEDSCVEFFISPEGDSNYYNFEFNCIGTILGSYGKDRHERERFDPALLGKIEAVPSLGRKPFGERQGPASWNLLVKIPLEVLRYMDNASLEGLRATGNFYKCGDRLPEPHYLSWSPVKSPRPDFHTPQFFGPLIFE